MFSACGCKSGTVKFHIPVRFLCSKSPLSQDIFVPSHLCHKPPLSKPPLSLVPCPWISCLSPRAQQCAGPQGMPLMRWWLSRTSEIPRATPSWLVKRLAADAPARQLLPLGAFVRSQPLTVGQTATGGAGHGGCGSAAPLLRAPDFDSNGSWPC